MSPPTCTEREHTMSNSFNMYRPTSRLSSAVVGYVAGKCDTAAKVRDNIKGRIRLAVEEIAAATKEKNDTALQGATRRKALLVAALQGKELSHMDRVFCGLVVEAPTVEAPVAQAAQ